MIMIEINNLSYCYKTFQRSDEKFGVIKDFFNRKYENHIVFDEIDLSIPEGKIIGLLGANGAGKTTLLKIMCGLLHTDCYVQVMGYNPYKKEKDFLKNIGVLFGQKSALIWDLPPMDTLKISQKIYDIPNDVFRSRVTEYVAQMNVADKLNTPVRKLSLGERMKFEILVAIIHDPKLLLLDEPTIGLDLKAQLEVHEMIKKFKARNKTVIITSHYIKDIENTCDDVIVLSDKKILLHEEIKNIELEDSVTISINHKQSREFEKNLSDDFEYSEGTYIITIAKKDESHILNKLLQHVNFEDIQIERNTLESLLINLYEKGYVDG